MRKLVSVLFALALIAAITPQTVESQQRYHGTVGIIAGKITAYSPTGQGCLVGLTGRNSGDVTLWVTGGQVQWCPFFQGRAAWNSQPGVINTFDAQVKVMLVGTPGWNNYLVAFPVVTEVQRLPVRGTQLTHFHDFAVYGTVLHRQVLPGSRCRARMSVGTSGQVDVFSTLNCSRFVPDAYVSAFGKTYTDFCGPDRCQRLEGF